MFEIINWPPGQRRLHRESFGKEAESRATITALFDTVATTPFHAHSRYQRGEKPQRPSGQIRVLICVGMEVWHTARCPDLDKARAYARTYIEHNIVRYTQQLSLLEVAV